MPDNEFTHRPISITVDSVGEMETVRGQAATETRVLINVKMDRDSARALVLLLLGKLLIDQPVDLVTFHLNGTLK